MQFLCKAVIQKARMLPIQKNEVQEHKKNHLIRFFVLCIFTGNPFIVESVFRNIENTQGVA
ncbi:hypothetical protein GCM10020331_070430 [Ectobacillus funiculus]